MRPRTFILIILVLLLLAAAVVLVVVFTGGGAVADLIPGVGNNAAEVVQEEPVAQEPGEPAPTATPAVRFVPVVVARARIPLGTRIEAPFVEIELRPETNIAVQAGYVFSEVDNVVGRIARTSIDQGQAILDSMVAVNATDLASMGSDLALYVSGGNVALAFPIDRYSGAAYAMRPGDLVDVLATLSFIDIDEEFRSALPNWQQIVNEQALAQGGNFLFPRRVGGRLELIPEVNLVAAIGPQGASTWSGNTLLQIPRPATQLTIQQAEVLWVGTWEAPAEGSAGIPAQQAPVAAAQPTPGAAAPQPTATPMFERREVTPDAVILSMPLQDALALKWALDRGANLDLALRAQGDNTVFITADVTLPQMVEQGGLTIPESLDVDLAPRADDVEPPFLPPQPPQ